MSVDDIITGLRDRGLERHATLLESSTEKYLNALANPHWEKEVKKAVGDELYEAIEAQAFEPCEETPKDTAYEQEPLMVKVTDEFRKNPVGMLEKAGEQTQRAHIIIEESKKEIFSDYKAQAEADAELAIRAYKDFLIKDQQLDRLEEKVAHQKHMMRSGQERLKRLIDIGVPLPILDNSLKILAEYSDPEEEIYKKQEHSLEEVEEIAQRLIKRSEEVLDDDELLRKNVQKVADKQFKNIESDCYRYSSETIKTMTEEDIELMYYCYSPLTESGLIAWFQAKKGISYDSHKQAYPEIMKLDLKDRQSILESHERILDYTRRMITGIEQLLEGGRTTNPDAQDESVLQNDARFPNIQYSERTMDSLKEKARELKQIYETIPDVSDMVMTSKMKTKRELTYTIRELPKNPLDITFGNDSGCCIFLPKSAEELQNGRFVADYLTNPHVKLFGVYESNRRMGSMLAFDMIETSKKELAYALRMSEPIIRTLFGTAHVYDQLEKNGKKILAVNSLELSRNGLKGGVETVRQIVDYAEEWIVSYAQQEGYEGVTIGSHSYNTSANYSRRAKETVEEFIVHPDPLKMYSDVLQGGVFRENPENRWTLLRPKGSYWLWRKEELM